MNAPLETSQVNETLLHFQEFCNDPATLSGFGEADAVYQTSTAFGFKALERLVQDPLLEEPLALLAQSDPTNLVSEMERLDVHFDLTGEKLFTAIRLRSWYTHAAGLADSGPPCSQTERQICLNFVRVDFHASLASCLLRSELKAETIFSPRLLTSLSSRLFAAPNLVEMAVSGTILKVLASDIPFESLEDYGIFDLVFLTSLSAAVWGSKSAFRYPIIDSEFEGSAFTLQLASQDQAGETD